MSTTDSSREALLAEQAPALQHITACIGRAQEQLPKAGLSPAEAELIRGFLVEARQRAQELQAAGEQLAQLRNLVNRHA
ncbi:hypothetical protein [Pseudomonas sp. TE50-2]|uniref:hypothetical protein n=1 Tax=Pseudomonas sp. TE50-2 TaxID=3142707 RepID=UPI003465052D